MKTRDYFIDEKIFTLQEKNTLARVFGSWFNIMDEYTEYWGGDALYWYNERANVGAFAGALSRQKVPYLEEYKSDKTRRGDPQNTDDLAAGRTDLGFGLQDRWCIFEAKFNILSELSLSNKNQSPWKEALDEAIIDAKRSWEGEKESAAF